MESSNQIKILIDSKRLVAYRVSDGQDGRKTKLNVYEERLEKNNLPKVLAGLKEKIQVDHVSLFFTDDLVLTGIVEDESNSANDREAIGRLVKTKLSIDLSTTVWDYTKVLNRYQIVCLPDDYTSYIAPAFEEAGIKVDSIEPVSVSLAKSLSNQSEPTMLVYDDIERLTAVCWQGLVFEPTLFIPVELSNKAKKIKTSFKKQFNVEVSQAIVSATFAEPYIADMTALSLNAEVKLLDPLSGVEVVTPVIENTEKNVVSNDLSSAVPKIGVKVAVDTASEKPENYREVWEEKIPDEDKAVESETGKGVKEENILTDTEITVAQPETMLTDTGWVKPKRNLTWLWIIIPLIVTFIAVGYLLISKKNSRIELFNPLIESSIGDNQLSATISGQLSNDDKSKFKIQVLNGSGKAGEAAKVKGLLETTGFIVETVGNASTSDASKTEIKSKIALTEAIKKDFQNSLSKLYDLQFTVAPVTGFDVIVTVGKSK